MTAVKAGLECGRFPAASTQKELQLFDRKLVGGRIRIINDVIENFLFLFLFHRVKPPFFYKDKAGNRELPVRLCWKQKKFIPGCFNLHELPGEYCEADSYQIPEGSGAGRDSPEPFPPVSAVRTGQGRDMVFVKEGLSAGYRTEGSPVFAAPGNRNMDGEGDL